MARRGYLPVAIFEDASALILAGLTLLTLCDASLISFSLMRMSDNLWGQGMGMKFLRWLLGSALVVAALGAAVFYMPEVFPTPASIGMQLLLSDAPFMKPSWIDWGYLKLRSGQAGRDALITIEQKSVEPAMRQASVAVQIQWFEKGHEFGCLGVPFCQASAPLLHETRFDELRLPADGMKLPRDLKSGQIITESFWVNHRFRIGCNHPPSNRGYQASDCHLRMLDMDNDGKDEVILDQVSLGTLGDYVHPVVRERWAIYKRQGNAWPLMGRLHFCEADQVAFPNARAIETPIRLENLWFDGTPVNFFDSECIQDGDVDRPDAGMDKATKMAGKIGQVPVISSGDRKIPPSLAKALATQTVVQPAEALPPVMYITGESLGADFKIAPRYKGLPPCFVAADPKGCIAIVADIDHDANYDVIIIDKPVRHGTVDYRLITLLMIKDGRWQVVANHDACSYNRSDIAGADVAFKPSAWRPVLFAGRLYVLSTASDNCEDHYPYM